MDAYHVLVIVNSVLLAIFLILAIAVAVLVIQLIRYLKQVSEQAATVMHNVENVGEFFRKSAGPMALARLLGNIVEGFVGHKQRNKKER